MAGKAAYDAYYTTWGWRSFREEPLPQRNNSPDAIRDGWSEVARTMLAASKFQMEATGE